MNRNEEIIGIETQLAEGNGSTYERFLSADALVVVPGAAMTKEETVAAMDGSPGWLMVRLCGTTFTDLAEDLVMLSYDFSGQRADMEYEAHLTSIYRATSDGWRMVFHQQTPAP